MKLEEFNKLTVSCRCVCCPRSGVPIDMPGYQARQWALDSIRETKKHPKAKRIYPRVGYDGSRVIFIGVGGCDGDGTQEVTP